MNETKRPLMGFIGCGNMGSALAGAAEGRLYLSDKAAEKANELAARLGATATDTDSIFSSCDFVFLGVKPQNLDELLSESTALLNNRVQKPVLVSMAAGIKSDYVRNFSGCPVIRIMPNLPVSIGQGTILYLGNGVTDEQMGIFLDSMKRAGSFIRIEENQMDAGSAVSGCGPAFVYMFVNALARAGEDCGLDYDTALKLAVSTTIGASEMLRGAGKETPEALVKAVCSPKGSTIEGVSLLKENSFELTLRAAVAASYSRNIELGRK